MIDLSTGRQAHTISVDLEPLGDNPTHVWSRIATYVADALRRGTKKNGNMVVFGRVGPGMSPSNTPTTLLYLMFVDSGRRGLSQQQAIAINTALMPLGAWIEGTHIVPDDSVPLFMHVDGKAMRIAIRDDAGDWVRFALDRFEGSWTFVADVYASADVGVPIAELGVDLPVALVGGAPQHSASHSALIEAPQVNPVLAILDLRGVAAQFGPVAWVMLQDHLARLVERCAAPGAELVIRFSVHEHKAKMVLAFQYQGLRVDMAKALFEVFEDFAAKPMLVAMPPLEPGTIPLFATRAGELYVLGSGEDGRATPALHIKRSHARLTFERLPEGKQIQLALRRVRVLGMGMAAAEVERQLVMRVAQIAEA
jgi:hypothetical protein